MDNRKTELLKELTVVSHRLDEIKNEIDSLDDVITITVSEYENMCYDSYYLKAFKIAIEEKVGYLSNRIYQRAEEILNEMNTTQGFE